MLFKCSQARAEASSRRWEEFPPTASSPFQDFTPSLALGPPQEPPLSAPAVDQRPRLVTVHWRQLPTWASPVSCSLKLRLTHRTSASSHFLTLNSLSTVVFGGGVCEVGCRAVSREPPGGLSRAGSDPLVTFPTSVTPYITGVINSINLFIH